MTLHLDRRKVSRTIAMVLALALLLSPRGMQAKNKITHGSQLASGDHVALGLNYHRVRRVTWLDQVLKFLTNNKELNFYSVSVEAFESQIKWLKEQDCYFLTYEELIEGINAGHFPERSVWINFDDMDQTIYDNAHPILEKYQVPATGYVITGQVGNLNFRNLKLADLETLTEMDESGLWTFHTHTHDMHYLYPGGQSKLTRASLIEVEEDLALSQEYLYQHFHYQSPPNSIAYPYGLANELVNHAMDNLGIEYGFTLEDKAIDTQHINLKYIPRIMVSEDSFNNLIKNWRNFK